jgi:hypothetical protein
MAVSEYAKTDIHGSITLSDGTGTPVTLALSYDMGDLSITGLAEKLNEVTAIQRRGKHVSLAHGARTYPSVSFSAIMTQFTEASAPGTLADFILRRAAYSANISTTNAGGVYTIDIVLTIEGTDFSDAADHTVTLTDVACTLDFAEGAPNSFSISGQVYGAVTGDLATTEIS